MHQIDNGEGEVNERVSFETWQRETNIHYEDDKSGTGSRRSRKSDKKVIFRPPIPAKSQNGIQFGQYTKGARRGKQRRSTLNLGRKHFVTGSNPKREIIGGSQYSRAPLVYANSALSLTKGPGPDNLKYLEDVDHLFFKRCKQFPPEIKNFDPKNKRGIWNSGGRCVYYVGETEYFCCRSFRSGFTYEVVDYLGRPVMTSVGSQWWFGLRGHVSVKLGDDFLLGTMEQKFLSSSYNIRDGQGRVVYTIQVPCYIPMAPWLVWCTDEEFEICMDDGISEIGMIGRYWGDEFPDFQGDRGIEFENSNDNRVKALILGAYFLLEFQYYKNGGNGVSYMIIMIIWLVITASLLSNCFGFCPSLNCPFVYEDPKEM